MKYLISCVFLFSCQLFFSQNIEKKSFSVSFGLSAFKVIFEKEDKVTFVSSHCMGSDVSKGKYSIKNDTIYCEYSPFVLNFSNDSIYSPGQLTDSIEFQFTFHSVVLEDTCSIILMDSTLNYIQTIKFPKNNYSTIKTPRNLNHLTLFIYNKYNYQELDFTESYIKIQSQSNNLKLEIINYSNYIMRSFQKYYFDPNDPSIIWLKNTQYDIKMTMH
jgi:hypothetical protein